MRKIGIVYDLSEPGGVQTCVFSLIKGLNRIGITPIVFWDKAPDKKLISELKLNVIFSKVDFFLSSTYIKRFPASLRYIMWPFNQIKSSSISNDISFIYSFTNNFILDKYIPHLIYTSGPPLLPQLEPTKITFKIIKFFYSIFLKHNFPIYEIQKNVNYVTNSKYISDIFHENSNKIIDVIYPSNNIPFSGTPKFSNKKKYITFFSRIVEFKRPEFIIAIAEKYPNLNFIIMGAVPSNRIEYLNRLKGKILEKHLSNVQILPNVSKKELTEILNETSIYLFPGIGEHFGITTVECILSGCIPLVHDSGGQREIVPDKRCKFIDIEFDTKFEKLLKMEDGEVDIMMMKIIDHLSAFSEDVYIEKMLNYIDVK